MCPATLVAVGVRLQPATELGHLPRHDHAGHVLRELLPAPAPPSNAVAPSPLHAARTAIARRPPRLAGGPQPAPPRTPCLRPSAESVRLQPGARLGHLQRHGQEPHVQSALLPARTAPQPLQSNALPPRHVAHRVALYIHGKWLTYMPPVPQSYATRHPPLCVCPPFSTRQFTANGRLI